MRRCWPARTVHCDLQPLADSALSKTPHNRYHSWTGVTGPQDSTEASEQVQDAEENLDAQQQQQLQQALQQQQQQQGRKLMQGPATQAKINEIAAINSGKHLKFSSFFNDLTCPLHACLLRYCECLPRL